LPVIAQILAMIRCDVMENERGRSKRGVASQAREIFGIFGWKVAQAFLPAPVFNLFKLALFY